jgi:DNA end-binding protein Ku
MADARWKGSIKVGPLVQFPVNARAAIKPVDDGGSLNMAHTDCLGQLRQQYFCEACGETGLGRDAAVRTYKGVLVDTDVLAGLAAEKTDVMELDGFVPADQIDPRFYQKSYDLVPQKGGEQAYALFLSMLTRSNRVAIGSVVMRGTQYIVTIRPRAGVLALEVMYWPEELTEAVHDEAAAAIAEVTLTDAEKALGDTLANMLARDFDPTTYKNTQAEARRSYLEAVAEGNAPVVATAQAAAKPTVDLADALAASIAALQAA